MQLIFILSLVWLVGAIWFVSWWHRTYRRTSLVHLLREDVGHIGVSAIVAYPETSAPLVALLEEEYPRSEAIFIADLQQQESLLSELVVRYHLVKVNHLHLTGARALYRSRRRTYRRVVVVDLPATHSLQAFDVGKAVASYDNLLYLRGESVVEPNALAYCANVVASQPSSRGLQLRSVVGADAYFERGDVANSERVVRLCADAPLAWRRGAQIFALTAMFLPSAMILSGHLLDSKIMLASAVVLIVATGLFLYVSCCVVTKKSLIARLDTVLRNFYRFMVERIATIRGSRIHDTPPCLFRVRVRNRPAHYREDSPPKRSHPSRPMP